MDNPSVIFLLGAWMALSTVSCEAVAFYTASQYILPNSTAFGCYIEGASVDEHGNVFAVNYRYGFDGKPLEYQRPTLGRVAESSVGGGPNAKEIVVAPFPKVSKLYLRAERGNWNGARFYIDRNGLRSVLIVDKANAKVIEMVSASEARKEADGHSGTLRDFCSGAASSPMTSVNDIAITKKKRIFATAQLWTKNTVVGDGSLWTCGPSGGVAARLGVFGRVNGIELSPDEKHLYVTESFHVESEETAAKILRFDVDADTGAVSLPPKVFIDFQTLDGSGRTGADGMRADTAGNLYVTRYGEGGGKVQVFSPDGVLLADIRLSMSNPTNLEFGGAHGRMLFVVGLCPNASYKTGGGGCVDTFRSPYAGKAFTVLREQAAWSG